MTKEEAQKINSLYQQIDGLQLENNALKTSQSNLLVKLDSIEAKLDTLLHTKRTTK